MTLLGAVLPLLVATTPGPAVATDPEAHPGFVPFERIEAFASAGTRVEVNLQGALLAVLAEAAREDDPAFAAVLDGLTAIRVEIVDYEDGEREAALAQGRAIADRLAASGWERSALMRSGDEVTYVYARQSGAEMDGLLVMIVEDEGPFVFVNLVGAIDPAELGRLGRGLRLSPLEELGEES